ncbi:MAG: TylF/MycF/NovP-related O-methyltransferase [Candidatus Omnitrophota bacterium]
MRFILKILRKAANRAGFDFIVSRKTKSEGDYELILSGASYAPWLSDHSFNETFKIISSHTLVDKYKCYELWQLVGETAKLNGGLIEVGVWKGGSGILIAQKAKLSGIRNHVYLCDTFRGVVKAGEKDARYMGGEHADTSMEIVEKLADDLRLDNIKIVTGIFPEETHGSVMDRTFRFCHVDVDVYESAKDVLEWLWPKVVVGGVMVFDDYGFQGCNGVTRLINDERNRKDRITIHNLNGHAILIKVPEQPEIGGDAPDGK